MSETLPQIEESSKLNLITSIWIVPIIAIIIALWLGFQYYSELGPQIEITFESNEGLKEGQSLIKYRDVSIGKVEKVMLGEDGKGVKVIARINKEAADYVHDKTNFWIVKPEVGIGGVSGLDTILSGTYINMSGEKLTMNKQKFIGLNKPLRENNNGEYFHLNAQSSYGIQIGTPVYFKSMKAGNVENITIALDGESVDVVLYVEKPYISRIHTDTKFWVQSSIAIDYLNGQLNLSVAPMTNIIRGGIEFSSSNQNEEWKVSNDYIFQLYKDNAAASEKKIGKGGQAVKDYYMIFTDSTAKLKKDASIQYNKFDVGRVKDIDYRYDSKKHLLIGKIVASIDTSVFYDSNDSNRTGEMNLEHAVKEGLRASLQEHDPMSGFLYVNLDFIKTNKKTSIIHQGKGAIFPTISSQGAGVMSEMSGLIKSIRELPLEKLILSISEAANSFSGLLNKNEKSTEQLLSNLNKTLDGVNKMVGSKEFASMPSELNQTMKELQKTLRSLDSVMQSNSNESLMSSQLTETLKSVNKASMETQRLLKKLDRKPNSLIFGD